MASEAPEFSTPLPVGAYEIVLETERGDLRVGCQVQASGEDGPCELLEDTTDGYYEVTPETFLDRVQPAPRSNIPLQIRHVEDGGKLIQGPVTLRVEVAIDGVVRVDESLDLTYRDAFAGQPEMCGSCEKVEMTTYLETGA